MERLIDHQTKFIATLVVLPVHSRALEASHHGLNISVATNEVIEILQRVDAGMEEED